jgi:hypothetical protein
MSSLKNKLYNYEQAPPVEAWDKIAAALDESHLSNEFPSKLYNSEIAPPVAVWDRIAGSLDTEEQPRVVHMSKRGVTFFRYAVAAAVLIGIVTFGITRWTGNKGSSGTEGLVTTKEHQSPDKSSPSPGENIVADNNTERENTVPDENISHTTASQVKMTKARKVKNTLAEENIAPTQAIYAYNEHTPNLADRYVMLMTSNGIVRMSKKLGNIVCCVAGEEQDEDCKDQIKKWQEKLASSPVAPGNFMDVLSLLSSLNENEL